MAQQTFAGLNALQDEATSQRTSGLSDDAAGLLDVVAKKQFPSRMGGWQAVLQALTERANASPYAMEGLLSPQLQEMAKKLTATNARISRTFGPYGGEQTPAAMGEAAAGLDLPGLYSNAAVQAGQQRQNFLSGTSIMAPQGQQFTQETQRPVDLSQIAQQIAGIVGAGAQAYGAGRTAFGPGPTSGTLPTTMDAYNRGGYANTTYAPFGTAPVSGYGGGGSYGGGGAMPTFGMPSTYPYSMYP